MADTDKLDMF